MKQFTRELARFVERRSVWLMIIAIIITAILAPGLAQLKQETGIDTMISPDKKVFKDTEFYTQKFGDETNVILLEGPLDDIFSPENLTLLDELEQELLETHDEQIHSIISPVTILKMAADEAEKMGFSFEWNDPNFIEAVLHYQGDITAPLDKETISPQMAPLIPDKEHVLINITPEHGMKHGVSLQLVRDIEAFFSKAQEQGHFENINITIIGDVEIMEEILGSMSANLSKLLLYSIGIMAAILLLMFRVRWNLLSLFMVCLAALWTFGIMGYMGTPISMTTMAVLPILIGLGIDYSIQFHNRYQEEVSKRKSVSRAIISSIKRMFPVVGIALIATIIGFITLFISEVPMVQDFGLNLAVGIVLAFIIALFLLHSILNIVDRRIPIEKAGMASEAAVKIFERSLAASARFSLKHPAPIIIIAVIAALAGAVVDGWLPSKVDHEELMPQNSQVLKDIRNLREITGYAGELHFLIRANDVTSPEALNWINEYQNKMFSLFPEDLKRVDSPSTIITGKNKPQETGSPIPDNHAEIDEIISNTPSIYVKKVIYDNNTASLSFGIRHMQVEDIIKISKKLVESADPPEELGIEISPAGNLQLITAAVDAMMGKRALMNGICISAIFAVLLFVYRRFTRVVFTIIPVGMVLAWSSLALFTAEVPLNTMTAVMGVLVIGIGTEFIVLLLGRYEEEKQRRGLLPIDAMVVAISQTGRAIVTTALTTLGGFGILIASNFVLIRDFGIATTISVFLCLWASMVVMPPLVVWWDTRVATRFPNGIGDKV